MKHNNIFFVFILFFLIVGCNFSITVDTDEPFEKNKKEIDSMLNSWHRAAAKSDLDTYFALMDKDAVYIGTDPKEVWTKEEFKDFCKPYFKQGKTWNFKPLNRHIYHDENIENEAWFDETLDTWMGICRGSGVVIKKDGQWILKHYVLSITIPNEKVSNVLKVLK